MDSWQILHITDLHISDPAGEDEYLRADYFDEYLDTLAEKVKQRLTGQLDCIIITGDFIDKGKVENFPHAHKVISHLASNLNMSTENVAVCIGNHDILRNHEKADECKEARASYLSFASDFANKKAIRENERAILINIADGLWCLMIDATLGSKGEDHPGGLVNREADELMRWVKNDVGLNDALAIGVHYPVHNIMAEEAVLDEEDPLWHRRHIWPRGGILKERLRSRPERPQVVWLCGDIHKHFNVIHDGQCFIATGRLGTPTGPNDSQVRRHARIVQIPKDKAQRPRSLLLEFEPVGHSSQPHIGTWRYKYENYITARTEEEPKQEQLIDHKEGGKVATSQPETTGQPTQEILPEHSEAIPSEGVEMMPEKVAEKEGPVLRESAVATVEEAAASESAIELIDEEIQSIILKTIADSHLYHLGRFNTSQEEVSLSWVSIGPLLNEGHLLSSVINRMADWLRKVIKNEDTTSMEGTLLLGIDCWGAVLASQLSVLTGARNFCVALRAEGKHHVPSETISQEVLEAAEKAHTIVIVSDVVATGWSLRFLFDKISVKINDPMNRRWLALSIIIDPTQQRKADYKFIDVHGTVCTTLRMPLLPVSSLPDETIMPPVISFL